MAGPALQNEAGDSPAAEPAPPPPVSLESLSLSDLSTLRRGRYSTIHLAWCGALCTPVVIKAYHDEGSGGGGGGGEDAAASRRRPRRMATREAIMLKYLNSCGVPNVPTLHAAYAVRGQFHLVQQYCGGGDLAAALARRGGRGFPEAFVAARFAAPLLRTLAAMHGFGVVHRDVKLENVFLAADGAPFLGDFDLAVFAHDPPARSPVGTVPYMAPELLLLPSCRGTPLEASALARLGPAVDVWSLGVCLFELVAARRPFQGVSYVGVASAVLNAAREPLPYAASAAFADFVEAALTHDAAARPSAAALLAHPWIAGALADAAAGGGAAGAAAAAADAAGGAAGHGRGGGARSDSAGSLEEVRAARLRGAKSAPATPAEVASVAAAAAAAVASAAAAAKLLPGGSNASLGATLLGETTREGSRTSSGGPASRAPPRGQPRASHDGATRRSSELGPPPASLSLIRSASAPYPLPNLPPRAAAPIGAAREGRQRAPAPRSSGASPRPLLRRLFACLSPAVSA
ncbi:aurora protein [Raphidocelis subcapitata]|uniref:Aurora protein n=1 Tax=Raphidocelis subcapitata TaxID=307507 RepID=A0A2V0PC01_9CHLO|nr:aurora protein [Raphidocelis subcapitata]|eukprot:GBF94697.1 aurora protein [Raphidocelis subcapitata]